MHVGAVVVLFRVRGVPVRVGWSWLLIVGLVLWSLAASLFPSRYPGLGGPTYLAMAAVATILFFASVLLHELSHTLRSLREGVPVRGITLWLFGGVSEADEEMRGPAVEFRIVLAGPLASAALAGAFLLASLLAGAVGVAAPWVGVLTYLAQVNALLLAFNLVPALPLDGGRLLHALLWWRTKDSAQATIDAALPGRAFAGVLVAVGLVTMLVAGSLGGLWFVLIGWFLLEAVRQEVRAARVAEAFTGLRVRDLMSTELVTVPPGMSLEEFADVTTRYRSHPVYPVVVDGRLVGLLELRHAGRVPMGERRHVRVADVMTPEDEVGTLRPDDLLADAAKVLARQPGRVVVRDPSGTGPLVGLLSATDLSRAVSTPGAPGRPVRRNRSAVVVGGVVAVAVVAVAAAAYHPPFVVLAPGPSFDVTGDVRVTGVPTQRPTGRYLLTSVRLSQPSSIGLLASLLRSDREVVSAAAVLPSGIAPSQLNDLERGMFRDSRQTAAVAAARAAGYPARLTGDGATVLATVPSSPAADALEVGDVVTAVDGVRVTTSPGLHDALAGRPAGETVRLTVLRNGRTRTVRLVSRTLPQVTGGAGIGVLAATKDLHAVLPFRVRFRPRPGVGGPSAGLAYALALTDVLDTADLARGRAVAATGTVSADGTVGAVGGVHEKAVAAAGAGAELLLVPRQETGSAGEPRLPTYGVRSLQQALAVLGHA